MLMWGKYWLGLDFEDKFKKEIQYWKKQLLKVQAIKYPFREPDHFSTKEETLILSHEIGKKLVTGIHEIFGTNTQILLVSAFVDTFKNIDEKNFVMCMEGHGREMGNTGIDVSNTMGWFTTLYPLVFLLNKSGDLEYLIREVKDVIMDVPESGISFGILKMYGPEWLKTMLGVFGINRPSYTLNYMGEIELEQEGIFKVIDKSEVRDISDKVDLGIGLTFNITIINKEMKISAIYNDSLLSKKKVVDGLARFEEKLADIIAYIETMEGKKIVSAGDFKESELSNEELDELFEYLDET